MQFNLLQDFLTPKGVPSTRGAKLGLQGQPVVKEDPHVPIISEATHSMLLKRIARGVLHQMGGVAALRFLQRDKFRVLMFHEFDEVSGASLEPICEYIARHFEPVSLSTITGAIGGEALLPSNAVTVTVDDGYRNFLTNGHPLFKRHGIPTTLFAVAGFADGRLWLWTDQMAFML